MGRRMAGDKTLHVCNEFHTIRHMGQLFKGNHFPPAHTDNFFSGAHHAMRFNICTNQTAELFYKSKRVTSHLLLAHIRVLGC